MTAADLPEAAGRRLASTSFSSGLGVADFAACQHMGLRPVGLVQGFCVMGWNPTLFYPPATTSYWSRGYRISGALATYPCPHSIMYSAEHPYAGFNVEAAGMERVWADGYGSARRRMLEEAAALGAHGVVGVVDATEPLIGPHVKEFHLLGTAVVAEGQAPGEPIWSTYLAGAKLAKLSEAGMAPVSIAGAYVAVRILPSCVTEIQETGRYDSYGIVRHSGEIRQLAEAATAARQLVRERVRATLGGGMLHGADLEVSEDRAAGGPTIHAVLKGTCVRRVRDVEPLPRPLPAVRLS